MTKGFKAMNADFTCKDFKFEVGKTYSTEKLLMCKEGFHFCENAFDVYEYYPKSSDTIICEVEALGEVLKEGNKSVTSRIKIVRQLSEKDIINLWINRTNSGYGNSGNRNSGDWNSGYGNSGNRNSGDWNSGDGNSGYFNTLVPVYFFNKPSNFKYTKEFENRIRSLNVKPIVEWVHQNSMTEQEKLDHPSHKVTGGFLRKTDRHSWHNLTNEDKEFIRSLPNFDEEVFFQITGVRLDDTIEIIVNGEKKTVSKAQAKALGIID